MTEAGFPERIAQTRAAAEFHKEQNIPLSEAIEKDNIAISEDLVKEIDEDFLQRLLDKMGVEAAVNLSLVERKIRDALTPEKEKVRMGLSVREMFDEFVIIEDNDGDLFQVDYTVDDNGEVTLGERRKVVIQYVESQMRRGRSRVQSLLFPKDKFTISEAKKWARDHDFSVKKAVTEGNFRRLRILNPNECESIRTMNFGRGIRALLCINR